jgi:succinyl-CoA synthetase beta subunit
VQHGINVPRGAAASTPAEAAAAAAALGGAEVVVKAQVLAGGRGKGHFDNGFQGGVHLVRNDAATVSATAGQMLQHKLITKQTGAEGRVCNKVLVAERLSLTKEYYFAILMDRAANGPAIVASSQGGMDIEAVAEKDPAAIVTLPIDIAVGLTRAAAEGLARQLGFGALSGAAAEEFLKLYDLFLRNDATMVEINPLAVDAAGRVLCMDAKFNFDDNAAFRQKAVHALRDRTQENALEVEAAKHDLNFIGLDGSIGCLVNGAGLAMATMDIIQLHGGSPANFLDVGGGASAAQVEGAFQLITSDPRVECIFVNIFGGIMRCDVIAQGILAAAAKLDLQVPVVVRLQGTRSEEARALIKASSLPILAADDLETGAQKAVQVAKIVALARAAGVKVTVTDLAARA